MNPVKIEGGTRVKVTKILDGDCYFGEEDGLKMIGLPATLLAHYPDDDQEDGSSGTRGGCSVEFDKTLSEIFGLNDFDYLPGDNMMVFADVELEVIS